MSSRADRLVGPLLLVATAAYFVLGVRIGLEWSDTGMILYPSWRVAQGDVPYRDFLHFFGPSLFYANAAIFWLFGPDLLGVRLAVAGLKAATMLATYGCARTLAAWPYALGATVLAAAVWGAPLWLFNAPYANHYALLLCLLGFWLSLRLPAGALARAAAAGLCFGLASTFKQTSGLFALAALALALLWTAPPAGGPAPPHGGAIDRLVRLARAAVLAGIAALAAAYLTAPRNTASNVLLVAGPLAALLAVTARREWRGSLPSDERWRGVLSIAVAALAAALPLLASLAFFTAHGALGAYLFNTLTGLPHMANWFSAFLLPPAPLLLGVVALLLALYAVRAWRGGLPAAPRAALAAGVVGLAAVVLAQRATRTWDLSYVLFQVFQLLPLLVAWGGVLQMWRAVRPDPALGRFAAFAAVSMLYLHPAGDLYHICMLLPAVLPLLAYQVQRWMRPPAPRPRAAWAAAAGALGLGAALCVPFVLALVAAGVTLPRAAPALPRATGIVSSEPKFRAAAALLDFLAQQPAERPLLVLPNESVLYLLSGRESVLAGEEFVFYMVNGGVIADADAHSLLSDAGLAARIADTRPLLVEVVPDLAKFERLYPLTTGLIAAHYSMIATFGPYRVLERVT